MKKYVITGGPGFGKTTQVNTMAQRGYYPVQEAARWLIDNQLKKSGDLLPNVNRLDFQRMVIEIQLHLESQIPDGAIAFLDRGLPDNLAYFKLDGVKLPEGFEKVMKVYRYEPRVFLLEEVGDLEEILKADPARIEDPEMARAIHYLVEESYTELGYEVIKVPADSPKERADFILSRM